MYKNYLLEVFKVDLMQKNNRYKDYRVILNLS